MSVKKLISLASFLGLGLGLGLGLSACQDQVVQLTVFHTNDIHSHLKAPKAEVFGLGGVAKLSTLLTQLRAQNGPSVTVDAGDWSEGTWYYSIDEGANMLRILDTMKYDAACLGNHDFLQGPDQLIKTIPAAQTSFPVLAANLDSSAYPNAAEFLSALPASYIKTVGGLKIGFIGLTTFGLLYNSYMTPVEIINPIDITTKLANEMRPNVDVLLVISHNDFSYNMQIAQQVPGIDAVISGHTHVKTTKPVLVLNAGRQIPVVETGDWAQYLGDLKLSVNLTEHAVTFSGYQMHAVTPDLADDPAVATLVTEQDQKLDQEFGVINEEIAESDVNLMQADSTESLLGNLAVQAYRFQTGADVALEEISLTGVSIAQGAVTLQDLHDVVPHLLNPATGKEWELNIWNATGADLFLAASIFYTTNGLMPLSSPLGWLSVDNAVINWDPANTVPTIETMQIAGAPLDPKAYYNVALTDGLLSAIQQANSTLHLNVDLSRITPTGIEAWRAVVNYAQSLKELSLQNLGIGRHAHTTTPDLSIHYFDLAWDGTNLSLAVHNNGLQISTGGTVACYSGLPNDYLSYNAYPNDIETWTKLGTAPLPVIAAGAQTIVTLPWSSTGLAQGFWPVKCVATPASGDPYISDKQLLWVLKNGS